MTHRKTKAPMFCAVNGDFIKRMLSTTCHKLAIFFVVSFPVQPFLISATAEHLFCVVQPLLLAVLPNLLDAQPLASL